MSIADRDHALEVAVGIATTAIRDIASRGDCDYCGEPSSTRPRPCPCATCVAKLALETIEGGWRYIGARSERTKTMPRERRIMEAWRAVVDSQRLGQILSELPDHGKTQDVEQPTPRDWFVATTVVQWLATNVGMEVLRQAGFHYTPEDDKGG